MVSAYTPKLVMQKRRRKLKQSDTGQTVCGTGKGPYQEVWEEKGSWWEREVAGDRRRTLCREACQEKGFRQQLEVIFGCVIQGTLLPQSLILSSS